MIGQRRSCSFKHFTALTAARLNSFVHRAKHRADCPGPLIMSSSVDSADASTSRQRGQHLPTSHISGLRPYTTPKFRLSIIQRHQRTLRGVEYSSISNSKEDSNPRATRAILLNRNLRFWLSWGTWLSMMAAYKGKSERMMVLSSQQGWKMKMKQ